MDTSPNNTHEPTGGWITSYSIAPTGMLLPTTDRAASRRIKVNGFVVLSPPQPKMLMPILAPSAKRRSILIIPPISACDWDINR